MIIDFVCFSLCMCLPSSPTTANLGTTGDLAHGNHDKPNGSHYTPNNNNSEHLIENEAAAAAAASSLTKDKCEQNNTNHRPTTNDATTTIDSCRLDTEQSQLMSVKRSDRNKFFGSLPILDSDEMCEENCKLKAESSSCSSFHFHFSLLRSSHRVLLPVVVFTFRKLNLMKKSILSVCRPR